MKKLLIFVCAALMLMTPAFAESESATCEHEYIYQYDAVWDDGRGFVTFGTWQCERCGDILQATEGNAVYYYSLVSESSQDEPAEPEGTDTATAPIPVADPQAGLWIAILSAAALAVMAEAVVLTKTLHRGPYGR